MQKFKNIFKLDLLSFHPLWVHYLGVRHVSTTKPLQCRNGFVVDTCLTKVQSRESTVDRANAYLALSNFTPHTPPLLKLAMLANDEYCAGKYYAETDLYCGSAGNRTPDGNQTREHTFV